MYDLIAIPLGWVMRGIYQIVHSYGISILLFTIFVKFLTLPSTYKMQVNSARTGLVAPKLEKIRKAFPNNPQRVQAEQNKLYTEEGINPSSGCLGSIVTMILLLGVFRVVLKPMTHILRIGSETITAAKDVLAKWLTENQLTEKYLEARTELVLLKYAQEKPEIFANVEGFLDKVKGFNNNFLGFDLTGVPTFSPDAWTFTAVMLVLLPVLAALTQLIMTIVTQRHQKKNNPAMQSMGAMNVMLYLTPLMTICIGMSVPAGLSFYWLVNSVLSLLMQLAIYKYLGNAKRLAAINEKEKQKQLKKGPGWMQRMMEQSAQMQAEQNGTAPSKDGNRARYADGDDGMSRKERAEYDRKLIEAARRRAAEKYGEPYPEDNDPEDAE